MNDVANNIVAFMLNKEELSAKSATFIYDWIKTDGKEKTKVMYNIWDSVLRIYLPTERPVIFRACSRISKREIQSFTGRIRCAEKFSDGHKGYLLICDTAEYLYYEDNINSSPPYEHSFFPVYDLIRKNLKCPTPQFTQNFYDQYKCEDEYILRVNINKLYDLKWNRKS